MRAIANLAASAAASGVLVLAAVGVALPIGSTQAADSCASGPGAAAPAGEHWYYRIDRATHRKCWFTHAIVPEHSAAEPRSDHAMPAAMPAPPVATPQRPAAATPQAAHAAPAPQPVPDPADGPSEVTGTTPAPHITVLSVKPDPTPFSGTVSPSKAATESTAEAQTPPVTTRNAAVPERGDFGPVRRANSVAVSDSPSPAAAAPDAFALANSAAIPPTQPPDLFFLRAFAIGIAAALFVLFGKMAGLLRRPRLSNHPDDVWRRVVYERNSPFLVPQDLDGPTDLNQFKRIGRSTSAPADVPAPRPKMERLDGRNKARPVPNGIEPRRASAGRRVWATATLDRD